MCCPRTFARLRPFHRACADKVTLHVCQSAEDRCLASTLLEKVLVNSFDVKRVLNPTSDVMADHQLG
jgi:hypothetical protein